MDGVVVKTPIQPRKYPVRSDYWLEEVREFYRHMVIVHALSGDGLLMLKGACSALNRARRAEMIFDKEGHRATHAHGYARNQPATEVRESERMIFLCCMRGVGIDYDDIPKTITLKPLRTI